jgi:UDP-N-acetylglucosamine 2-epimerase (non-hydrolysing)
MKVMTILGTRPEIIRLSRIIEKLDSHCTHILVHTGQNFDKKLNEIFFEDLKIRMPDYFLNVKGASFGEQIAQILIETEKVIEKEHPDRLLILGDTNSSLGVIIAKRMGIPVIHMEAGNRCFDDRVPEEVNRRIIDHSSDVLLPYTERSRMNLIQEGIATDRIHVIGNPIYEVIEFYQKQIDASDIIQCLGLKKGNFFLVTMHRAENVDKLERLGEFLEALKLLAEFYQIPIVCSLHPRTKDKLEQFGLMTDATRSIQFHEPFGFFDFISLEKHARCVISDSGTVQEECCIFHIPNVTIRDVTERPETIECGSNILTGADRDWIVNCVKLVLSQAPEWNTPDEYVNKTVSTAVTKIVLGFNRSRTKAV